MVAALHSSHARHEEAWRELASRVSKREKMILAAPALVETYSVLTRLPAPHRLAPKDVLTLLTESFIARSAVVALEEKEYVALLKSLPGAGIAGGRSYDAVIAACALKSEVSTLLTFNPRDFAGFESPKLRVVVPGNSMERPRSP